MGQQCSDLWLWLWFVLVVGRAMVEVVVRFVALAVVDSWWSKCGFVEVW